ncbi:hypothetical protein OB955_00695 [Halobacteria archaeon AArc-m2/3/4]|uniref:Uncharacterized protein n=1 Tax=Natronoglomus mannanivorans TaxID=2979990 RepID=A0AAP2YYZ1_9EURY|nr:hypothetical protein [Halobacteria archaeon AArc-xg1-1]MCU4971256.1 hypothetical protein [Halobacteria archaeon AArc-m2/3/4]
MMGRWLRNWSGEPTVATLRNVEQVGPVGADLLQSLGPLEQAILALGATILLGVVVLGLLPGYGRQVVETTQRSPIISICIGVPAMLVLASLVYLGWLLSGSSVGVFFAIPLVSVGLALSTLWVVLGLVALGGFLAGRVGSDRISTWVFAGSLCSGLSVLYPPAGVIVVALAASLGIGAGVRVALSSGGVTNPEERVVPPANKI